MSKGFLMSSPNWKLMSTKGKNLTGNMFFFFLCYTVFVSCVVSHKLHKGAANTKLSGVYQSFTCVVPDAQIWGGSIPVWLTTYQITFRESATEKDLIRYDTTTYKRIMWLALQNRLCHWHFQNLFSKFVAFMGHQLLCLPRLTSYQWAATLEACQRGLGIYKYHFTWVWLASHIKTTNIVFCFKGVLIRCKEIDNVINKLIIYNL